MSITLAPPPFDPWALPPEPVKRWTVEEYHNLIRLGALTEDDPYELIEGWLVTKVTHNPPHDFVIGRLNRLLMNGLTGDDWIVRPQLAITLEDGEPEPDFAICRGPDQNYCGRHPSPAEIGLVIEVSDTTLARDRGMKLRSYARAGIEEYWIVNLLERQGEVYSSPNSLSPLPSYAAKRIVKLGEELRLILNGQERMRVAIDEILPAS